MITDLLQVNALFRLRAAQGVVGQQHGPQQLEQTCARTIEVGDQLPHHQRHPRCTHRSRPCARAHRRWWGRDLSARSFAAVRQRRGLLRPSGRPHTDTTIASGDQPGPVHDKPADPDGSDYHEPDHTDQFEFTLEQATADQPASSEEAS